jgi:uncharacterized repeat protein (TIGR03803 family)
MNWHATSRRAAVVIVVMVSGTSADAQVSYDVVAAFDRPWPHGAFPGAGLIQATDGNFYGTTAEGGPKGGGVIFRIRPDATSITWAKPADITMERH